MSEHPFTLADLETLRQWDTPTICNGLEVVVPERRATGFTVKHMQCLDPKLKPICGFARTAMIRALTPATQSAVEGREMRAAYYAYVGRADGPTVTIIQDLDPNPGFGAFWGEVNTAIHKGLGSQGCVTNGSFRDLDDSAPGFQLLGGKVGPSHAHVHLVEYGSEVNVFGMAVKNNDIIHADQHGAVVIPAEAVTKLPAAIDMLIRREAVILGVARGEGFTAEVLKQAMAESAEIH
jgi:regulator of RNase E activity RraA